MVISVAGRKCSAGVYLLPAFLSHCLVLIIKLSLNACASFASDGGIPRGLKQANSSRCAGLLGKLKESGAVLTFAAGILNLSPLPLLRSRGEDAAPEKRG